MKTALTVFYVACFQLCAWPAILRIVRRKSSGDCSLWREGLVLMGVCAQFGVMSLTGSPWQVWISPILSGLNVSILAGVVLWYRGEAV